MKKYLLTLILLLTVLANLSAQNKNISIEKVVVNDKLLTGTIDDKYKISIYLKFYASSGDDSQIYSVKGWYYYDKVKKKIPLVGIYYGDLTLYVFKTKEQQDKVLNFKTNSNRFWEGMEELQNLQGYTEKFNFSCHDKKNAGEWTNSNKKLNLRINNSSISIFNETEYLKIKTHNKIKRIKMADLGIHDTNILS